MWVGLFDWLIHMQISKCPVLYRSLRFILETTILWCCTNRALHTVHSGTASQHGYLHRYYTGGHSLHIDHVQYCFLVKEYLFYFYTQERFFIVAVRCKCAVLFCSSCQRAENGDSFWTVIALSPSSWCNYPSSVVTQVKIDSKLNSSWGSFWKNSFLHVPSLLNYSRIFSGYFWCSAKSFWCYSLSLNTFL